MCRGERQGNIDSPILFNIVIDELVRIINPSDGISLGNNKIGCLLFADDIILLGNTEFGMCEHLRTLQAFREKTHMEIKLPK